MSALNIQGKTCIHSFVTPEQCGKPVVLATHDLLCRLHYPQQQNSIPPKPRLPQPRWRGPVQQTDEQIIADIIATDAEAIRVGHVVRIVRGMPTPVVMRILEN